jgi:hypothetical protein
MPVAVVYGLTGSQESHRAGGIPADEEYWKESRVKYIVPVYFEVECEPFMLDSSCTCAGCSETRELLGTARKVIAD